MKHYDVCIIGAGVLGCAIARELNNLGRKNFSVAVLEKNPCAGMETSSRNSGVLHSGFHQDPASLKARFAKEGSRLAYSFAKANRIPLLDTGMIIAIPNEASLLSLSPEWKNLWNLLWRGKSHGIHFKFLTSRGVQRREPYAEASGGIFIPEVSVIDSVKFVSALEESARHCGAEFFYGSPVVDICPDGGRYCIVTKDGEYIAKVLINAAGNHADEIANMALCEKKYTLYPWRGEYYELAIEKREWVQGLIYPAVPSNSPGKGIHFGRRPDGRVFLGPNARRVSSKTDYESDKTPVDVFLEAGQKFFPELQEKDLRWAYSGIRPKLSDSPHEDDFIISVDSARPTLINNVGIDSPGFAAALGIARHESILCQSLRR